MLIPGGRLQIVTDHQGYFEENIDPVVRGSKLTVVDYNRPGSAAEGEFVGTNFERKYRREGRPFYAVAAVKGERRRGGRPTVLPTVGIARARRSRRRPRAERRRLGQSAMRLYGRDAAQERLRGGRTEGATGRPMRCRRRNGTRCHVVAAGVRHAGWCTHPGAAHASASVNTCTPLTSCATAAVTHGVTQTAASSDEEPRRQPPRAAVQHARRQHGRRHDQHGVVAPGVQVRHRRPGQGGGPEQPLVVGRPGPPQAGQRRRRSRRLTAPSPRAGEHPSSTANEWTSTNFHVRNSSGDRPAYPASSVAYIRHGRTPTASRSTAAHAATADDAPGHGPPPAGEDQARHDDHQQRRLVAAAADGQPGRERPAGHGQGGRDRQQGRGHGRHLPAVDALEGERLEPGRRPERRRPPRGRQPGGTDRRRHRRRVRGRPTRPSTPRTPPRTAAARAARMQPPRAGRTRTAGTRRAARRAGGRGTGTTAAAGRTAGRGRTGAAGRRRRRTPAGRPRARRRSAGGCGGPSPATRRTGRRWPTTTTAAANRTRRPSRSRAVVVGVAVPTRERRPADAAT